MNKKKGFLKKIQNIKKINKDSLPKLLAQIA